MKNEVDGRREIASRNTAWANNIARKLTRWGCHSQSNFHDECILRYDRLPPADWHSYLSRLQ